MKNLTLGLGGLALVVTLGSQTEMTAQQAAPRRASAEDASVAKPVIERHCITCHN